jgi:hypothetical protein
MKPHQKICDDFARRVPNFYDTTEDWRQESAIMDEYYDHHPTETGGFDVTDNGSAGKLNQKVVPNPTKRVAANASVVTAWINGIVGLLVRDQKQIVAYSANEKEEPEAHGLNKGFRYFDAVTHRPHVKTEMLTSSCIRGVGATVTYLDFSIDGAIAGQPVYEEKENIFFDKSYNGKLYSDQMGWCGYAEPMYQEALDEYVEKCSTEKGYIGMPCPTSLKDKIFEYKSYEDQEEIDFLYIYYWREYRKVWDIENPFKVMPEFLVMLTGEYPEAANVFAETAQALQLDFEQSHFTLDDSDYKKFKALLENMEFMTGQEVPEIEASSRMGRAYYKAEFANGLLLKAGRTFTSQCHPMSFTSAYYDKTYGYHYGLMRPLSQYQKMLNSALSDYMTYAKRSASGGNVSVSGAADTIDIIKKAMEGGNQVTPALNGMEIRNIGTPDAGQSMMGVTDMILKLIPMSMGMPPELFGMLSTGDMTSSLMNKIKQQMSATLSHLANGFDRSSLCDGWIMRDLMITMAQGIKGKLELNFVLGGEEGVFELSRNDLARNYTIQLIEREATRDEQLESYEKLVEWADRFLTPEQKANAAPVFLKAAPLYLDKKKEIVAAIQPPQADPAMQQMQQRQAEANVRLIEAQALQLENQAKMEGAMGAVAERKAALTVEAESAKVYETMSKANKNLADVEKMGADTQREDFDALVKVLKPSGTQQ